MESRRCLLPPPMIDSKAWASRLGFFLSPLPLPPPLPFALALLLAPRGDGGGELDIGLAEALVGELARRG